MEKTDKKGICLKCGHSWERHVSGTSSDGGWWGDVCHECNRECYSSKQEKQKELEKMEGYCIEVGCVYKNGHTGSHSKALPVIGLNVWLIKGKMERNMGKIILECGVSRTLFNEFFEELYGKDYPEGAEMPLGEYRVMLYKKEDVK